MSEDRKVKSTEDVIAFWIGRAEFRELKRRFYLFSFWSALAFVGCAAIILAAILWYVPGSADSVARLFAVDMFRENFPKTARLHSYLAQKDGRPWDVFLPAMTAITVAACAAATVFSIFWLVRTPLTSRVDADGRNSQLLAGSRSKAAGTIFFLMLTIIILAGILSIGFGWGGNPDHDFSKARRPIELLPLLQSMLMSFIPPLLVGIALLVKFRRMLKRLQARAKVT